MCEEAVTRWASTVAFVVCALALMWLLGAAAAPWVGCLAGTVVFGVVAGPLWARHLDRPRPLDRH